MRLIRIAGADCAQFLQGQLTQDVRTVTPARSALFGWTNAQGRLLLVGQMFTWRDALWLSAPAATAQQLTQRLRQFVLRSRVTVDLSDLAVLGVAHCAPSIPLRIGAAELASQALACTATASCLATRVAGDPSRILIAAGPDAAEDLPGPPGIDPAASSAWLRADIGAGLPRIDTGTTAAFIPQMVNLDLLGGVSFAKGCYSGQEIVTRTRHLGRIKRRMLRFGCDAGPALTPGAAIFAGGRESGRIVAAADTDTGQELLAVTQVDILHEPLFADADHARRLTRLDLPYAIPETGSAAPG